MSSSNVLVAFVIALVSFLCRSHAVLDGGFIWDDRAAVLSNADVLAPTAAMAELFRHDFWGNPIESRDSHKSFRPLAVLSLRADVALWMRDSNGVATPSARPFRVHNLVLHSINAALLFLLGVAVSSIGSRDRDSLDQLVASVLSALIFSLHPVQTEAVASIVGRADLLATSLFLASLLCYLLTQREARSWLGLAASLLLALAASLSKETAFACFGALLLAEAFLHHNQARPRAGGSNYRSFFASAAIIVAVASSFLQWRLKLNSGSLFKWSLYENQLSSSPVLASDPIARWLTTAYSHALYALLTVWPFGQLSYYHGFAEIQPVTLSAGSAGPLALTAVAYASLAVLTYRAARKWDTVQLFILFGLVLGPFLPASNVLFFVGTEVAERLLYLPMSGVALLAGNGALGLFSSSSAARIFKYALLGAVLAAYFFASSSRGVEWQSERALFMSAVIATPTNIKALANLATFLAASPPSTTTSSPSSLHDWALSRHVSEVCVSVFPEAPACWSNLALLAEREANYPLTLPDGQASLIWSVPEASSAAPLSQLSTFIARLTRALRWRSSSSSVHSDLDEADKRLAFALTIQYRNESQVNPTTSRGGADAVPFTGRARALEANWRAVSGSADSGLALPCTVTEGLAELYLQITKERHDTGQTEQSFSVGDSTTNEPPLAVPLPDWAILAGSTQQLAWMRNLQGKGIALHPATFALLFLDGALRLRCGGAHEAAKEPGASSTSASSVAAGSLSLRSGGLRAADLHHHRGTAYSYLKDHASAIAEFALEPEAMLSSIGQHQLRFAVTGCASGAKGKGTVQLVPRASKPADPALTVPQSPAYVMHSLEGVVACSPDADPQAIDTALLPPGAATQLASASNMISLSLRGLADNLEQQLRTTATEAEQQLVQGAVGLCQHIVNAAAGSGSSDNDATDGADCVSILRRRSQAFLSFAMALQPNNAAYRSNAASTWFSDGDLQGALAYARDAVALEPNDAAALTNYGFLLENLGDGHWREAFEAYSKARELAPGVKQIETNWRNLKSRMEAAATAADDAGTTAH